MQEEVTQKTIALSMKTGKLTAQALQAALKKYLQHRAKGPKPVSYTHLLEFQAEFTYPR